MRKVTVAATQMSCSWDREENMKKAESLVRQAAEKMAPISSFYRNSLRHLIFRRSRVLTI